MGFMRLLRRKASNKRAKGDPELSTFTDVTSRYYRTEEEEKAPGYGIRWDIRNKRIEYEGIALKYLRHPT